MALQRYGVQAYPEETATCLLCPRLEIRNLSGGDPPADLRHRETGLLAQFLDREISPTVSWLLLAHGIDCRFAYRSVSQRSHQPWLGKSAGRQWMRRVRRTGLIDNSCRSNRHAVVYPFLREPRIEGEWTRFRNPGEESICDGNAQAQECIDWSVSLRRRDSHLQRLATS